MLDMEKAIGAPDFHDCKVRSDDGAIKARLLPFLRRILRSPPRRSYPLIGSQGDSGLPSPSLERDAPGRLGRQGRLTKEEQPAPG